ncbi:hypothetical protein [Sulfuracidifex metallicus]|uniref:hypothetical protein n=1 Tax=Sulfuracidifex metallicus TaxID=47303 RepID=UPI0012DDA241|nr:hypothetical protein [Sulfuracidifex metallicus]WOE49763.1 hypothetical protein RQ359_001244 [Sulfuracidifex metallicus DSM 6482 = JCM 9184]
MLTTILPEIWLPFSTTMISVEPSLEENCEKRAPAIPEFSSLRGSPCITVPSW